MSETPQSDLYQDQLNAISKQIEAQNEMLAALVQSHNSVGENIAWLVANVQGIFQMFNDPKVMSQLMGKMMGGGGENG